MMFDAPSYVDVETLDGASASSALTSDPRLQQALSQLLGAAGVVQTAFDDGTGTRFQVYVWLENRFYKVTIAEAPESLDLRHRQLSPREQEIAGLITKGLTNKAIAQALLLRPTTVNTYAKRLFLKLNVSSRVEMVAKVMSENLLEKVS